MPADAPGAHNQSGYAVDMEAMHQLHCLNLLRKGQYFNHEYYSSAENLHNRPSWAFRDPERNIRGHINHCIDALRERIMCAADDEVLPYWWRDGEGMTISDFAVTRQCKNFEAVRSFAEKHQLPDWGMEYKLETPPDAHVVSDIL
ncbi:hypothetical protein PRZ48_011146 [Zasmidium cellare]|uniref:Tat pathway signal sequence n=1 Tax=Zasmidium cellare TaxID=395010 RepID=A0ABR0EBQ4_ZASCE|nr:hypothetical protein PRZ48_011146 [Zasmidium cellare]